MPYYLVTFPLSGEGHQYVSSLRQMEVYNIYISFPMLLPWPVNTDIMFYKQALMDYDVKRSRFVLHIYLLLTK